MTKNIKLLIACHKECEVPDDSIYVPMHVGAAGKEKFGFTADCTGDNISEKNPLFCELTGLYWAWKNLDYDWLGLVHYRRYFTLKNAKYRKENGDMNSVLTAGEAEDLVSRYRVIVPKKRHYYIESVYNHYDHTFDGSQLDKAGEIIRRRFPAYAQSFDKVMKSRSIYLFNMFIMDRELTNNYLRWLFDILFELETQIDTENMTAFEKRYAGRVSERLFNVWLDHKIRTGYIAQKDVHEVPYLYMGEIDWTRKVTSFLKAKFFKKKYDRSF